MKIENVENYEATLQKAKELDHAIKCCDVDKLNDSFKEGFTEGRGGWLYNDTSISMRVKQNKYHNDRSIAEREVEQYKIDNLIVATRLAKALKTFLPAILQKIKMDLEKELEELSF